MAFYFTDSEVSVSSDPPLIQDIEDIIDSSSREMLDLVGPDGTVKLEDFAPACEKECCTACQFRYTCSGIAEELA